MIDPKAEYQKTFTEVTGLEGGYGNNKNDSGGATKFGCTEAVARANGYNGKMQDMTIGDVCKIFKSQYWDELKGDQICVLSPKISHELFDTGINMGTGRAGTFLQRALNVLNMKGTLYADMKVDGQIGPMTVASLKAFLDRRGAEGEKVILRMLNGQQCVKYIEFAEANPTQEEFEFGWVANRVD